MDTEPVTQTLPELFTKAAAREMKDELNVSRVHLDPRLEISMITDNADATTVRGRLFESLSELTGDKEPAGLLKTLEDLAETPTEGDRLKATVIKAAFGSFTITDSALKKLAESKGLSERKLRNDASWTLLSQMVVVRSTEFIGTHFASSTKGALEPANTFKKVWDTCLSVRDFNRKKIADGGIKKIWPEYSRLSSQDTLSYSSLIGNTEDGSDKFAFSDSESSESIQGKCTALAGMLDASVKSYFELKNYAEKSGQPLGYLDEQNQRIPLPDTQNEIPIALCLKKDEKFQVKIIMFDRSEQDIQKQGKKIYDQLEKSDQWAEIGEEDRALFAVNLNLQDRILSEKSGEDCFNAVKKLRPMAVLCQGKSADGKIQTELIANHTAMDGLCTDIFINGTNLDTFSKDSNGSTLKNSHKINGIKGFYNKYKSEEGKLSYNPSYSEQMAKYEIYPNQSEKSPDVIISRIIKEGEQGADVLQASVLFANEIFIDYMRELHGGVWNDMENGANNTHVDKNNPLERLVPGSLYRRKADKFQKIPGYGNYSEVLSLLTSLGSYKENRWMIDNFEENRTKPEWQEHNIPASCEAMAVITNSKFSDNIKRNLLKLQKDPRLDYVRFALTYNQTIVVDKAAPGVSESAATHKTVNNDGLPGVSIREEGEKLEMTFSQSLDGRLMPPNSLFAYSELVTNVSQDFCAIFDQFQKNYDNGEKPDLQKLNLQLSEIKKKHKDQLYTHADDL